MTSPLGFGDLVIDNFSLGLGLVTYSAISLSLAPGGPGSGPYLGLHAPNLNDLLWQIQSPLGTPVFHYIQTSHQHQTLFPMLPGGLSFEALTFQIDPASPTGIGASDVVSFATQ